MPSPIYPISLPTAPQSFFVAGGNGLDISTVDRAAYEVQRILNFYALDVGIAPPVHSILSTVLRFSLHGCPLQSTADQMCHHFVHHASVVPISDLIQLYSLSLRFVHTCVVDASMPPSLPPYLPPSLPPSLPSSSSSSLISDGRRH